MFTKESFAERRARVIDHQRLMAAKDDLETRRLRAGLRELDHLLSSPSGMTSNELRAVGVCMARAALKRGA